MEWTTGRVPRYHRGNNAQEVEHGGKPPAAGMYILRAPCAAGDHGAISAPSTRRLHLRRGPALAADRVPAWGGGAGIGPAADQAAWATPAARPAARFPLRRGVAAMSPRRLVEPVRAVRSAG